MFAGRQCGLIMLAGVALLAAGPALADVKDGVDAWTRGDFAAAVAQWNPPAGQGDPDALFNLGQAYKLGRGVPQDIAKAEVLFGEAAGKGHQQASDNYGLLLFQRGERDKALPYIAAAAERGDPRAQYILGIAHFNGDTVAKDWVRAYALIGLARQAGLPQAATAIGQMDQHIPLDQRQKGAALAQQLAADAKAARERQVAAADLGASVPSSPVPSVVAAPRPPRTAIAAAVSPRLVPAMAAAPAEGRWKIQLGAFAVPGNAEQLWERVKSRPEIAGRTRLLVPTGKANRLLAVGFASQAAARSACATLSAAGFSCLAVAN